MANNRRHTSITGIIPLLLSALGPSSGVAQEQQPPDFADLAARCAPAVHITTLGALVRQESGGNLYRININGGALLTRQPRTAEEAASTARWLIANGYDIDMGLGQINASNLGWLGLSYADAFKPCDNLNAMARILLDDYQRSAATMGEGQTALQAALSYYNTGSPKRGFRNGYVQKVIDQAAHPLPALVPAITVQKAPEKLMNGDAFDPHSNTPAQASLNHEKANIRASEKTNNKGEPDIFSASADKDIFIDEAELGRK